MEFLKKTAKQHEVWTGDMFFATLHDGKIVFHFVADSRFRVNSSCCTVVDRQIIPLVDNRTVAIFKNINPESTLFYPVLK